MSFFEKNIPIKNMIWDSKIMLEKGGILNLDYQNFMNEETGMKQ